MVLAVVVPFATTHNLGVTGNVRPAIVENGSSVVTYRIQNKTLSTIAFAPDGSSFTIVRNGILKIAPNGAQSILPNAVVSEYDRPADTGSPSIVYANGFLWYEAYRGIVRERPDGTGHRWYQFGLNTNGFLNSMALTASSDGIYFTATHAGSLSSPPFSVIGHIDAAFQLSVTPVAALFAQRVPQLVWSPDNRLDYFEVNAVYDPAKRADTFTTYMYQLQADGSSLLLGTGNGCTPSDIPVSALGAIYFIGSKFGVSGSTVDENALCRATVHGSIQPITPRSQNSPSAIAVDSQGDIWSAGFFSTGLRSYNLLNKAISNPANLDGLTVDPEFLYVGPDQNVYFYSSDQAGFLYGAYVRHQMVVTPNSLNLNAFDNASIEFFVAEPVKGGAAWTARSLDPSVATVTPTSSIVGRFHVNEVHVGSTTIVITDALGNVSYVPVTAN